VIAEAAGRHIEDHVLASGAKLRAYFLDRETLSRRVAIGQAVVRSDHKSVAFGIGEEHRGGIGGYEIAGRLDRVPQSVLEVE